MNLVNKHEKLKTQIFYQNGLEKTPKCRFFRAIFISSQTISINKLQQKLPHFHIENRARTPKQIVVQIPQIRSHMCNYTNTLIYVPARCLKICACTGYCIDIIKCCTCLKIYVVWMPQKPYPSPRYLCCTNLYDCINCCATALEFVSLCQYNCLENCAFLSLHVSLNLCKGFLSNFSVLSCSSSLQDLSLWNVNNELGFPFPRLFVCITSISKSMAQIKIQLNEIQSPYHFLIKNYFLDIK